jgi:hypothetical protein
MIINNTIDNELIYNFISGIKKASLFYGDAFQFQQ